MREQKMTWLLNTCKCIHKIYIKATMILDLRSDGSWTEASNMALDRMDAL